MGFATRAITCLLAAASSLTAATPLAPRQYNDSALEPWQVQSVDTHSPGRPGNYPWRTVRATIVDPNAYNLGAPEGGSGQEVTIPANNTGLNCEAKWIRPDTAYGKRWACDIFGDAPIGYWYMEVIEVSPDGSETTNFDLKFTRVIELIAQGRLLTRSYQGQANFAVGKNMRGTCGGSGVCNWGLREENTPFPVQQERIDGEQVTQADWE